MAAAKTVTLMSSDGENFDVDEAVAMESQTIKNMIEDVYGETVIPLPNVSGKILAKVIEYCEKHVEVQKQAEDAKVADEEIKTWGADFVKVDQATLFHLFLAADYLDIEGLLDLTFDSVAELIEGKTREEILDNYLKSLT